MAERRSSKPPRWYDGDSTKDCDHEKATQVRSAVRYSDFAYFKYRCDHPDCDEEWCTWLEG